MDGGVQRKGFIKVNNQEVFADAYPVLMGQLTVDDFVIIDKCSVSASQVRQIECLTILLDPGMPAGNRGVVNDDLVAGISADYHFCAGSDQVIAQYFSSECEYKSGHY
jgi:hypothetical protein